MKRILLTACLVLTAGRLWAYTNPCPSGCNTLLSETPLSRLGLKESPNCMCDWNVHTDRFNWEYLDAQACVQDHACTLSSAGSLDASGGSKLRVPLKSDPGSPSTGEMWVNGSAVKVRDNAGSPVTQTLVNTARAINTTAPLAGGGDHSADRTLTCNVASGSQPGCLASADWTTFNNKPSASRTINTTAPLTGGGDLSADRTFACNVASGSQPGCLASADFTTFNSKVSTSRSISTTAPISGGGDLSANRTLTCDVASGSQPGCLASADWTTFNNKVGTSRSISTTAPLQGGGDLSGNRTFTCDAASGSQPGCLSSADWTTFNNKISGLTGSTTVDLNPGASACTDSSAFAVTSAADGDPCSVGGVNAAWTAHADLHFDCFVSSAGNVKIRACCHNTTACADPGSRTYKVFLQH